jgi:myo-inositol-1(or 4)-monophosphatase
MVELSESDLQALLGFTTGLARTAGTIILEGSKAIQSAPASNVNEKKNSVDLVTAFDVKVEEVVKAEIATKYPHFQL